MATFSPPGTPVRAGPTLAGWRRPFRHRARGRPILRGSTLVELAIVVCIIAIMASIAIPRFTNALARRRVEGAAERVARDFSLAQRRARLRSTAQTVSFNVPASSYRLVGLRDLDRPALEYEVRLADPPYEVQISLANFGGDATIIFDGFGVPDSGGSVVIEEGGYQASIALAPENGQTSVNIVVIYATPADTLPGPPAGN